MNEADATKLHELLDSLDRQSGYEREALVFVRGLVQQTSKYEPDVQVPILFAIKDMLERLLLRHADESRWEKEEHG